MGHVCAVGHILNWSCIKAAMPPRPSRQHAFLLHQASTNQGKAPATGPPSNPPIWLVPDYPIGGPYLGGWQPRSLAGDERQCRTMPSRHNVAAWMASGGTGCYQMLGPITHDVDRTAPLLAMLDCSSKYIPFACRSELEKMHLDVSVDFCRGVPTSPCSEPGSADIESM
ncbi:hypothetical protein XANCAGTX0491_007958 [Xanthoria calcicola]